MYLNLIQISLVVTYIELQAVKNGSLAAPVNNTLVYHPSLLVTSTLPWILDNV